jgi:hypothetical protein
MDQFRVFVSAVTSGFGSARDALANDLQSHDLIVRVQRCFRNDDKAGTLLHKLRNYLENLRRDHFPHRRVAGSHRPCQGTKPPSGREKQRPNPHPRRNNLCDLITSKNSAQKVQVYPNARAAQ